MKPKKHLLVRLAVSLGILLMGLTAFAIALYQDRPALPEETAPQTASLAPPPENVFTPMDFGYVDGYLTCLTQESILGVDVSSHQQEVDWQQVKDAGFEFAMLRAGFRGYASGGIMKEDSFAQTNYENAKAAGLKIGAYFFSQAITIEEAVEEAQFLLQIVKDWELDMPLVFDWECLKEDYRTVGINARQLTDMAKAFCDTIQGAGHRVMVYFNPSQSRKNMYLSELTDYGFWLAMYSDNMNYAYKVDMWQYTRTGSVPGISGKADINLYFPYA